MINGIINFEDLSAARVDDETEAQILAAQTECTFIWRSKAGHPLGVVMSFVHHDGRFWLTASAKRGRVAEIADQVIAIDSTHFGRVEDAHMGICHMLCYAFMENPELGKA